jgi:hypothetical protein
VRFGLGFDPAAARVVAAVPGGSLLAPDLAWWTLETVLMAGLIWHGSRPTKAIAVWLAVLWMCASAARFIPFILVQTPS